MKRKILAIFCIVALLCQSVMIMDAHYLAMAEGSEGDVIPGNLDIDLPDLEATSKPTVNPLPTEAPHQHEFVLGIEKEHIDGQGHRYYEQCACGETSYTGDYGKLDECEKCYPTPDPTETPHQHEFERGIEKEHIDGQGHRYYEQCACGETEYTGEYGKLDGCEKCYPTSSEGDVVSGNPDIEIPDLEATSKPTVNPLPTEAPHQHEFVRGIEKEHIDGQGHRYYEQCACGETKYTGEYGKLDGCEKCYPMPAPTEALHQHEFERGIEKEHIDGQGHRYYEQCACGETEYTGDYGKLDGCEKCYPTPAPTSSTGEAVPGNPDIETPDLEATSKPTVNPLPTEAPHQHEFARGIEKEHIDGQGHRYYEQCDCGETRYTGEYGKLDGCEKCCPTPEPLCPHSKTDIAWDTNHSTTYKSVSDTEHSMTGYMYKYCTECFEHLGDSYAITENYNHTFDEAGDCTVCDYRAACKHTETTKRYVDTSYTSIDETYHKATEIYSLVCAKPDCGKVLVALDSSLNISIEEEHQFSGNACTQCMYIKADALTVTVAADQSMANTGDTISATATIAGGSGSYSIGWNVTLDGVAIDQTDMSMGSYYSFHAEKAGSYVFTATVKDSAGNTQTVSCSAIIVKVAHDWKTIKSTEIINQSVKIHDIVTTIYEECTICGENTEPVVITQSVEHVPVRTSHETDHPHQRFNVCRDCSAHPPIEGQYYTLDGSNNPQSADKCCICHGHAWQTDEPKEVNDEWREYCMNCGRYRTVDAPAPPETEPVVIEKPKVNEKDTKAEETSKTYEEKLEKFAEQATNRETQIGKVYDNEVFGTDEESMFNHLSRAINEQYVKDGYLVSMPEELYKMLTDALGYVGGTITRDSFSEEQISEIEYLVKCMLARQTRTSSQNGDDYHIEAVGATTEIMAELLNCSSSYKEMGIPDDIVKLMGETGKVTKRGMEAIGFILKSADIATCTYSDLIIVSSLAANYEETITMLDLLIEECGESSYIGIACKNVKNEIQHQFNATIDAYFDAANEISGEAIKLGLSGVIDLLAEAKRITFEYNVPISSNGKITGMLVNKAEINISSCVNKVFDITGSIMLGGQIGKVATFDTGRFLNAKDQLILLSSIDAQVKSRMDVSYSKGSKALLPLTELWLLTQQTGLDAAKEYYSAYYDSWLTEAFDTIDGRNKKSVEQGLEAIKDDKERLKNISSSIGIVLDEVNVSYYTIVSQPISFAGDRPNDFVYATSEAGLYSLPNKQSQSKKALVRQGTQMIYENTVTDNEGNIWYEISFGEAPNYYIEACYARHEPYPVYQIVPDD